MTQPQPGRRYPQFDGFELTPGGSYRHRERPVEINPAHAGGETYWIVRLGEKRLSGRWWSPKQAVAWLARNGHIPAVPIKDGST